MRIVPLSLLVAKSWAIPAQEAPLLLPTTATTYNNPRSHRKQLGAVLLLLKLAKPQDPTWARNPLFSAKNFPVWRAILKSPHKMLVSSLHPRLHWEAKQIPNTDPGLVSDRRVLPLGPSVASNPHSRLRTVLKKICQRKAATMTLEIGIIPKREVLVALNSTSASTARSYSKVLHILDESLLLNEVSWWTRRHSRLNPRGPVIIFFKDRL